MIEEIIKQIKISIANEKDVAVKIGMQKSLLIVMEVESDFIHESMIKKL